MVPYTQIARLEIETHGNPARNASAALARNMVVSKTEWRGAMAQSGGEQVQVQIKADEKELVGQFCNLVMFHHGAEEFTLHFIYVFPNVPQGKLACSVIVSPAHAKRILRALAENISRYEAQYGPIREVPEPTPVPNVGFVQ
jgi:hypothetical protein